MSGLVSRLLRVAKPKVIFDRQVGPKQFFEYAAEIEGATKRVVWKLVTERFTTIKRELEGRLDSMSETETDWQRLRSLKALVEIIRAEHEKNSPVASVGKASPDDEALADYLAHLCVYLNTTLFPREPAECERCVDRILGIDRCAFMARSLCEYYGGDTIAYPASPRKSSSYFYSIPVFVPAWKQEERDKVKTSILGMGTDCLLNPDDLRGWLHVAEQLVLPAQQQDVVTDESLDEAQLHLDAVIHAWRWDLQKVSANVGELNRFTSDSCTILDEDISHADNLRKQVKSSLYTGFLRCDLLERIVQGREDGGSNPRRRPSAHDVRHLDSPAVAPSGLFPLRYVALEAMVLGLSASRETLQIEILEPYTLQSLDDDWMASELMRVDPAAEWVVEAPALDSVWVDWQRHAKPAASWALILEEWASNVKKHRLWHASIRPWARILIKESTSDLVCELASGPSLADPDAERAEGHGQWLIRLCFEELAGQEVKPSYSPDWEHRAAGAGSWKVSCRIPARRWEAMWQ
jgi:hypothetical protein